MEYPEHDKMHLVKNSSQAIGEFLEWLEGEEIVFASYPDGDTLEEIGFKTREQWLATYFDIDLDKLEKEKLVMLKELKALPVVIKNLYSC